MGKIVFVCMFKLLITFLNNTQVELLSHLPKGSMANSVMTRLTSDNEGMGSMLA